MKNNQLHQTVLNEMLILKGRKKMFTAYDITRILQDKAKTPISHNDVRSIVEAEYGQVGLVRDIGYQLPYSPPPQIYHTKGQDIKKYDPNALLPPVKVTKKEVVASIIPAQPHTVKVFAVPVKSEYLYAAVNNKTGERLTPCKGNSLGLYKTRNGPRQLIYPYNKKDYKIVKYEIVLKEVE